MPQVNGDNLLHQQIVKRTSGRLFVPDLTFGEHIEMGENIFFLSLIHI